MSIILILHSLQGSMVDIFQRGVYDLALSNDIFNIKESIDKK